MGQPLITLYTSDPSIPSSSATPYILTDHNRKPAQISYETLEQSSRMADGTMRKFVTANKKNISISWDDVPSAGGINFTSDGNQGGAFLKSFYEENVFKPIWIKMTYSEESWRFKDTVATSNNYVATNQTFNSTLDMYKTSSAIQPSYFQVASVAYSAFSSGSSTASITTLTSHNYTSANVPEIFISGVNQLFNGAWILHPTTPFPNSKTIVFRFNGDNNSDGSIMINSYIQNGSSATFNVDSTDILQKNMTFNARNSRPLSGSVISTYNWTITKIDSKTQFTASTTTSGVGRGIYGEAHILNSASSYSASFSGFPLATVTPAVGSDIIKVFIKDFSYEINKRYVMTDIVNMSISFTEI